jgi:hypothetical protein
VILRIALRLGGFGCIAPFIAALYLHSQPALVSAVVAGVALAIVKAWSLGRSDPLAQTDGQSV